MKILTFTITILLFSAMAQEESSCFSLNGSSTCPAFQNFYISIYGNTQQYPFLNNVTDISSFDAALRSYVISPDLYLSNLGCEDKAETSTSIPYARYSLSYICATLIQDSLHSLPCNYQNNRSPPPLCQSTCYDYTASINSFTNNVNMCPNQLQQKNRMAALNSTCQYWSGLNGTDDCIIGMANEPESCGFNSLASACQYCRSTNGTNDVCCETLHGCRSLSVAAIIGIIVGCLVFTAIVGAIIYWFCCFKNKQRKNHQGVSYNGFMMNQKHEIHEDNDSSSVLGYESSTSQNAFAHQPAKPLLPAQPSQPPMINTTTTNNPSSTMEEFYQVKHPYPPQMGDELGLHVGDIVCVAMNFDDGWALGFNVTTGLKGVFPVVCVTPAPEELLEQLLFQQESATATTKTLVEDGKMQQLCENLRRSISISSKRTINTLPTTELTQHNNIPRRTASIMKSNYDYRESDSPTSPTTNTPFFDVIYPTSNSNTNSTVVSQPEPALFHQPIETYEMHRKNNRVSKLEQE